MLFPIFIADNIKFPLICLWGLFITFLKFATLKILYFLQIDIQSDILKIKVIQFFIGNNIVVHLGCWKNSRAICTGLRSWWDSFIFFQVDDIEILSIFFKFFLMTNYSLLILLVWSQPFASNYWFLSFWHPLPKV
jgi:hypothetical protein